MRKEAVFLTFLILSLIALTGSPATLTYHNSTLQMNYYAGDLISGSVMISLSNESANSMFKSNFEGNVSLIAWLKNNSFAEGIDYNCSTKGCMEVYISKNKVDYLDLAAGREETIGLRIVGKNIQIEDLNIKLRGNGSSACTSPLSADLTGKGDYLIQSKEYTETSCEQPDFGCFDEDAPSTPAQITERAYCEKITLPPLPAMEVGAKVAGSGQADLKMEVYSEDRQYLGSCEVVNNSYQISGYAKCIVNYSSARTKDYFICILDEEDSGRYTINLETEEDNCGLNGLDAENYLSDYQIYAKPLKFKTADISVNQTTFDQLGADETIAAYVQSYIDSTYGDSCTGGCFVPLELKSGVSQRINISEVFIEYSSDIGSFSYSDVYLLEKVSSKVNMGKQILKLSQAGFFIPANASSQKEFVLYLNNKEVFGVSGLNITPGFDFDIYPKEISIAQETEIRIISSSNVSSSVWKFDNSSAESLNDYKIRKIFYNEGLYEIEVKAVNKSGAVSRRKFEIVVGNSQSSAELILNSSKWSIYKIRAQLTSFDPWIKAQIERRIRLNDSDSIIKDIEKELNESSPENSSQIIKKLLSLNLPESVNVERSWQDTPLEIGSLNINAGYIEKLSNKTVEDSEAFREEILKWMRDNYEGQINTDIFSVKNKKSAEANILFSAFAINISALNGSDAKSYLIIDYPLESFVFFQDYGQKEVVLEDGKGVAIPLEQFKNLRFLILEEVEPMDLKSYISATVDFIRPSIGEIDEEVTQNPRKPIAITLYFVMILAFFVVYIIAQEWYKRYYESSLFKNKDDLYNVLTFIHNSRMTGITDFQIKKKLEDSSWRGEQINFALRKIDGKRTGMFEIPLFKIFERRKMDAEIERRNQLKSN